MGDSAHNHDKIGNDNDDDDDDNGENDTSDSDNDNDIAAHGYGLVPVNNSNPINDCDIDAESNLSANSTAHSEAVNKSLLAALGDSGANARFTNTMTRVCPNSASYSNVTNGGVRSTGAAAKGADYYAALAARILPHIQAEALRLAATDAAAALATATALAPPHVTRACALTGSRAPVAVTPAAAEAHYASAVARASAAASPASSASTASSSAALTGTSVSASVAADWDVTRALGPMPPHANSCKYISNAMAEVTPADLATLRPGTWLNDEVINGYLALVLDRAKRSAGDRGAAAVAPWQRSKPPSAARVAAEPALVTGAPNAVTAAAPGALALGRARAQARADVMARANARVYGVTDTENRSNNNITSSSAVGMADGDGDREYSLQGLMSAVNLNARDSHTNAKGECFLSQQPPGGGYLPVRATSQTAAAVSKTAANAVTSNSVASTMSELLAGVGMQSLVPTVAAARLGLPLLLSYLPLTSVATDSDNAPHNSNMGDSASSSSSASASATASANVSVSTVSLLETHPLLPATAPEHVAGALTASLTATATPLPGRLNIHIFLSQFFAIFAPKQPANGGYHHNHTDEHQYDYQRVRRWSKTAQVRIWGLDKLILPCHVHGNHWTLLVADFRRREIQYYDSLQGSLPRSHVMVLRRYLCDEAREYEPALHAAAEAAAAERKAKALTLKAKAESVSTAAAAAAAGASMGEDGDSAHSQPQPQSVANVGGREPWYRGVMTGWRDVVMSDIPLQANGYDCGIFLLGMAEHVAQDRPLGKHTRMRVVRRTVPGSDLNGSGENASVVTETVSKLCTAFTQEDVPMMRLRIALQLEANRLA